MTADDDWFARAATTAREAPELVAPPHVPLEEAGVMFASLWFGGGVHMPRFEESAMWVRWARLIGPFEFIHTGEQDFAKAWKPTRDLILFRGARTPQTARGMSWTPQREIATLYAIGGLGPRADIDVYAARVPPDAMLARYRRNAIGTFAGDASMPTWVVEYVVDPEQLPDVRPLNLTAAEMRDDLRRMHLELSDAAPTNLL